MSKSYYGYNGIKMVYFLSNYKSYPYIAFNPNLTPNFCVNFGIKALKVSGTGVKKIQKTNKTLHNLK